MAVLGWILLGLVAGAIAKAVLPGTHSGGLIITTVLGIVGAMLGGFIGSVVFRVGVAEFFDLSTWLLAVGGAIIVLLIYGLITRGPRRA